MTIEDYKRINKLLIIKIKEYETQLKNIEENKEKELQRIISENYSKIEDNYLIVYNKLKNLKNKLEDEKHKLIVLNYELEDKILLLNNKINKLENKTFKYRQKIIDFKEKVKILELEKVAGVEKVVEVGKISLESLDIVHYTHAYIYNYEITDSIIENPINLLIEDEDEDKKENKISKLDITYIPSISISKTYLEVKMESDYKRKIDDLYSHNKLLQYYASLYYNILINKINNHYYQ